MVMTRSFWWSAPAVLVWMAGCQSGAVAPGDETSAVGARAQALEDEQGVCIVPDEVVTHSCAHASSGPFVSEPAQPYPGFVFTDISAPHTSYTLALPAAATGYEGAVLFSPAADGEQAFFTMPGSTIRIFDGSGAEVPLARELAVPAELCGLLEHVAVFALTSSDTYTVVYSSSEPSVQTIVEFVGQASCEECVEVHLRASRSFWPPSHEDGEAVLEAPIGFEVPGAIPVTSGSVAPGLAVFEFSSGGAASVECFYLGRPALAAFELLTCTGGLRAGDDVEADTFRLRVKPGAALLGPVTAELTIEDEACHGHED